MPAENIPLIFTAEITELRKKLETLPGMTKKEARAMASELTRAMKGAARDLEKGGLRDVVDNIGDDASKLAQGFGVLSSSAGGLATTVADVADGLVGILSVGGAAGAALAGIAVAGGSVVLVGGAVAGVVSGLVELVDYADQAAASVQQLGRGAGIELVSPATVATVERAADSMDALGVVVDAVAIEVAGQFAPGVENASTLLIAMGLAVRDVVAGGTELLDASLLIGQTLLDTWLAPIDLVVQGLGAMASGVATLAEVAGADDLAAGLRDGADAMLSFDAGGMVIDAASGALEDLRSSVAGYLPEAEALIGAQTRINNGFATGAAMAKSYADSLRAIDEAVAAARDAESALAALQGMERAELASTADAIGLVMLAREDALAGALATYQAGVQAAAGNDAQLLALQQQYEDTRQLIVANSEAEILSVRSAAAQAEVDQKAAQIEAFRAQAIASANSWMDALIDLSGEAAETIGRSNAAAGKKMWRFSQVAAIGQVAFNTAIAVMKAYAELGPVAGTGAALLLGAVGAAQALSIANQSPPSFATGGVFALSGGTTGGVDHQAVSLSPREAAGGVLTPRGVDAAGGARGVGRLNRGEPAQPGVVMNVLGGRLDDRVTRHQLVGPGALSGALDGQRGVKRRHRG